MTTQETQEKMGMKLHKPEPGFPYDFGSTPEEWIRESERIKKEVEDFKKKYAEACNEYLKKCKKDPLKGESDVKDLHEEDWSEEE